MFENFIVSSLFENLSVHTEEAKILVFAFERLTT